MPSGSEPILQIKGQFEGQIDEEQQQGTNLADLILEKIAAHEAIQSGGPPVQGGGPPEDAVELPAKVVEVYSKSVYLSQIATLFQRITNPIRTTESASSSPATNPANSPNPSKSSPPFPSGTYSSP